MTLQHSGFCHLSKAAPVVRTAANGEWTVSMRVYDRIGPRQVEPWLIIFSGDKAREWWEREGKTMAAGDTLRVVLEKARLHVVRGDRDGATAEMQAHALQCEIVARAKKAQVA